MNIPQLLLLVSLCWQKRLPEFTHFGRTLGFFKNTELAILVLLPTLYSDIVAVSFFMYTFNKIIH